MRYAPPDSIDADGSGGAGLRHTRHLPPPPSQRHKRNIAPAARDRKHAASLVNNTYLNSTAEIAVRPHVTALSPHRFHHADDPDKVHRRGDVVSFSTASRLRVLTRLAAYDARGSQCPVFVTLTWHYGHLSDERGHAAVLHAYLIALARWCPGIHYIWRLEAQRRGAPHYHLMLWSPVGSVALDTPQARAWISDTWHRIADPDSRAHAVHGVTVEPLTSYRRAVSYTSKYVAKEDEVADATLGGRRWATDRSYPRLAALCADLPLNVWHRLRRSLRRYVRDHRRHNRNLQYAMTHAEPFRIFAPALLVLKLLGYYYYTSDHPPSMAWTREFVAAYSAASTTSTTEEQWND